MSPDRSEPCSAILSSQGCYDSDTDHSIADNGDVG